MIPPSTISTSILRLPRRKCWPRSLTGADRQPPTPCLPTPLGLYVRSQLASFLTLGTQDPRNFNQTTVSPNFGPDHVQGWSFGLQRQLSCPCRRRVALCGQPWRRSFPISQRQPLCVGVGGFLPQSGSFRGNALLLGQRRGSYAVAGKTATWEIVRRGQNTGVSDYAGWQNELRATNLWNQLTLRTSFTWSKTTDNTSEIFVHQSARRGTPSLSPRIPWTLCTASTACRDWTSQHSGP